MSAKAKWSVTVFGVLVLAIGLQAHAAESIPKLMTDGDVPGLSLAIIRDGKIVRVSTFGFRNIATGQRVDSRTDFNAASLSKPVFSYAVLQLVDAGQLSLDEPLSHYLPDYIPGDARASSITARQVLSHTSGLPNGINGGQALKTYFDPGNRFSYSGEGFLYLQKVVEKITGENLEATMQRLVFEPLQMRDSSYVWQPRFEGDYAEPYDTELLQGIKPKYVEPKAAWLLETTAADYARFLQAILSGTRLKPETAHQWLEPQVKLTKRCSECLKADYPGLQVNVAWALGWGVEPDTGDFFHWGDNGQFKAFVIGSMHDRAAIVVFTNGAMGLSIIPDIIAKFMPGDHAAFAWLGYEHYDSPVRRFIHATLANGVHASWRRPDASALTEADRRTIAFALVERDRGTDALWLRERNVADYPNSAACHFELGESDLAFHRPAEALTEFKQVVQLDAARTRAALLVKLLETKTFPVPSARGRVEMHLAGFATARHVAAIGTFNGWEASSLPMRRDRNGWAVRTDLPAGSYPYEFSIDGTPIPDPANPKHATQNPQSASILTVDAIQ